MTTKRATYPAWFADRRDAETRLAERLSRYRGQDRLVLGIPRGGVPMAAEVARCLDTELDVIVARKVGAPGTPEPAIGAVTANGGRFLSEDLIRLLQVPPIYVERAAVVRQMSDDCANACHTTPFLVRRGFQYSW